MRILGIFAGLNYLPSSFIFVNIPSISQFQWHPFSITSSSSVDKHTMSVMMKCEGKWTDSVYKKVEEAAISDTKINNITIRVEGPYGPSSVDFLRLLKHFRQLNFNILLKPKVLTCFAGTTLFSLWRGE